MCGLSVLEHELARRHRTIFSSSAPEVAPDSVTLLPSDRQFVEDISTAVKDDQIDLVVLTGPRGTGKTTAAYQALLDAACAGQDIRVSPQVPQRVDSQTDTEVIFIDYQELSVDTGQYIEGWYKNVTGDNNRTLLLECMPGQWDSLQTKLSDENIMFAREATRRELVSFESAASADVVRKIAQKRVQGMVHGRSGNDLIQNTVEVAGNIPALGVLVAESLVSSDSSDDSTKTASRAAVEILCDGDHVAGDRGSQSLIEVLALSKGLSKDDLESIWNDIDGGTGQDHRSIRSYFEGNETLEVSSDLLAEAVIRQAFSDGRATELALPLGNDKAGRKCAVDIADRVSAVYAAARIDEDDELATQAVRFVNAYLPRACERATSERDWQRLTQAIHEYSLYSLPVDPALFDEYIDGFVTGYEQIADSDRGSHLDLQPEKMAMVALSRILAAVKGAPADVDSAGIEPAVESALEMADDHDIPPAEYYWNLFGGIVRSLLIQHADKLDDTQINQIFEGLEKHYYQFIRQEYPIAPAADTQEFNHALHSDSRADILLPLWDTATAKIIVGSKGNIDSDEHKRWLRFASGRVVEHASELDDEREQNYLKDFYINVLKSIEVIAVNEAEFVQMVTAFETVFQDSLGRKKPSLDNRGTVEGAQESAEPKLESYKRTFQRQIRNS